jgi:hypothetical protein
VTGGYEYTCMADPDGFTYMMTSGCVSPADESVQPGGALFQDDFYAYECQIQEDNSVGLVRTGCISSGTQVEEGGKVEIGNYVHECAKSEAGYLNLQPSGCIVDGGEVPIGETFESAGFWYTCLDEPAKKLEGCMNPSGDRLNPGETYFKDGFTVSCLCDDDSCEHKVTGCEGIVGGTSVNKAVSEEWLQGTAPFQYKCKCTTCSEGTTIVRTVPYCTYKETKIEPGCMTDVAGEQCGCGINQDQTLQVMCGERAGEMPFKQC